MNERQQKIQRLVIENGEVKLSELKKTFPNVSSMTLRRDLEKLENTGEIVRIRSGAKSIAHLTRLKEEMYSERMRENVPEKLLIAKKAHRLIEQGCCVFLDSGTTVTNLANLLGSDKLFVITTAPNIALECAKNPDITVFVTGGRLNNDNLSLSGMDALSFFEKINIDIAFVVASGYSQRNSFSCGNYDESMLKKRVIEKASKVVMLMDSSKYGKNLPFTFAALSDIDFFITDDGLDREFMDELQSCNIEIL